MGPAGGKAIDFYSISLVSGWLPLTIVVLALCSLALSLRWRGGVWKWQVALGVPIAAVLTVIVAILVDVLNLIPYTFPKSFYLWIGVALLALVVGIIGWIRFRWWRRIVSVLSLALTALMAFTLINQHYQYYPTVGAALGQVAQHQTSLTKLLAERGHTQDMPANGETVQVPIPGRVSGFKGRPAYVWVPPIWLVNSKIKLPVVEMLEGDPGGPGEWTQGGLADQTASTFAAAHNGVAPILVMPDNNGSGEGDTECVNSERGQAETYLTVDVPAFMREQFDASAKPGSLAVAGLSEGGMCSLMLTLRHPKIFTSFGDYSGLAGPTVGNTTTDPTDIANTIKILFGGSRAAYEEHMPAHLLQERTYPGVGGWFEVGTADSVPLAAQRSLVPLARNAGIQTCADEVPGAGHDFDLWQEAFRDSLPWLSYRLGLTDRPVSFATYCTAR